MYPIILTQIQGARVVVVGGGKVGERKVRGLLVAGADIHLISPKVTMQLQDLAQQGHIHWLPRSYQQDDLEGAALAFAATDQRAVNAQVAADAAKDGVLANIADDPIASTFHVPAVHRDDKVIVTVSTSGKNPTRARVIRDRIAGWLSAQEND
jgi:cobalt-precorrin 5A hydrolase / precorrin-3B C17-methyltransferase